MVRALEQIFGGEPTLNSYNGDGMYDAFSSNGGGGGGGYTPPVTPNPTYIPTQPTISITGTNTKINLISENGVVEFLENVSYEDNYEGDFTERRTIVYTLSFNVKTYYYGPIRTEDEDFKTIRKAQVDYYTSTDVTNATREVRYTVQPDPLSANADDNFGFDELYSDFTDAQNWNPVTGEDEPV